MNAEKHLFKLSMPRSLLRQVDERAKASRRSKTQEILVAIEEHLARGDHHNAGRQAGGQTAGMASQA